MLFPRLLVSLLLCGTAAIASKNYTAADIPKCSLTCLLDSLPITTCAILDFDCQCASVPLFDAVTKCSLANCTIEENIILSKIQSVQCHRPVASQQAYVRGWITALLTITTFFTMARFYSCWKVRGGFFTEDYLILAGLFFCYALGGLLATMIDNGLGLHIYQIEEATSVSKILKYFWVSELFYVITITTLKISLVTFFLRIFPQTKFRRACYCLIGAILVANLVRVLLLVFQCRPVSAGWDIYTAHPKCYNIQLITYVGTASNFVEDSAVLIFPIPLLLKLQINIRKKIAVLGMFSLGIFVIMTTLIRIKSIKRFGTSSDPTWENVPISVWTALEIHVAILCCNLPPIAGLIAHYKRDIFGSIRDVGTHASNRGGQSGDATVGKGTWLSSRDGASRVNSSQRVNAVDSDLESSRSIELSDVEKSVHEVSWHSSKKQGRVFATSQTVVTSMPITETYMNKSDFEDRWHGPSAKETEQKLGDGIMVSTSVVVKNELKPKVENVTGSTERLCESPVDSMLRSAKSEA